MLKWMLTSNCNRNCEYCIVRNIKEKETTDEFKVMKTLRALRRKHSRIMLTGGEPSMAIQFYEKLSLARYIFPEVYITTQNPKVLYDWKCSVNAITFSLHDLKSIPHILLCSPTSKIYASILDHQYSDSLARDLAFHNYSGLTINEEQRNGKEFKIKLPKIPDFSIRINHRGKCLDEDILLPNLKLINDFRPYL